MRKNINITTINSLRKRCFENVACTGSPMEKSMLIYLLLVGVPLPLIVAEEKKDKLFVYCGGNEIGTIVQFIRGEFVLEKDVTFDKLISEKIAGKTFFDFSDELKEKFLETEIAISVFRPPLNEEERKVAFVALSGGMKLSPVAIPNSVKAIDVSAFQGCSNLTSTTVPNSVTSLKDDVSKDGGENPNPNNEFLSISEQLEQLLTHKFFEKVNISSLTIDIPLQLFMITKDGVTSDLSSKKIVEFKEAIEKVPDIIPELDYMNTAFEEKKQFLKKAHLPMIAICAHLAIEKNINPSEFCNIIEAFFASDDPQYKKACDNGTASKSKVNTRLKIMKRFFEERIIK